MTQCHLGHHMTLVCDLCGEQRPLSEEEAANSGHVTNNREFITHYPADLNYSTLLCSYAVNHHPLFMAFLCF